MADNKQGAKAMNETSTLVREIGERLLKLAAAMEQPTETDALMAAGVVPEGRQIISSGTAAKQLGMSRRTVVTWLAEGKIHGAWKVEAGGATRWMIPASSIAAMMPQAPQSNSGRRRRTDPKRSAANARLRLRWTAAEDEQLLALVTEGLPYDAIGTIMRRSDKAVSSRLINLRDGFAGPSIVSHLPGENDDEVVRDADQAEEPRQMELSTKIVDEDRQAPVPDYGSPSSVGRMSRWFGVTG